MLGFAAAAVGWPMRTRRVRRMNVSGCSGTEASECGSRGCGFVQASAGAAWPLNRCSCIRSGCSGRVAHALGASTARAPADFRHPVLRAPGVRLYGRGFCLHRIARRWLTAPR